MKKIFINKFRTFLMVGAMLTVGIGCSDHDDIVTFSEGDDLTLGNTNTYLQVLTPVVSFQAGTPKYGLSLNALIGHNELSKINVYSTFTDAAAATGLTADEVLLTSFDLTETTGEKAELTDSLTFDDLKAGITLNGNPLPATDYEMSVGAKWQLRFEGIGKDGKVYDLPGSVNVAVLSPYAGLYRVVESAYYRIGVFSSNWNGTTRFIGSVDDDTFTHDYVGPLYTVSFGIDSWEFDVDLETFKIKAPADPANEPLVGDYSINCTDNAGMFANVSCEGSNVLIPDPVTGKHKIIMTYGYVIGTGVREFYEVLEKVVD